MDMLAGFYCDCIQVELLCIYKITKRDMEPIIDNNRILVFTAYALVFVILLRHAVNAKRGTKLQT